MLLAMIDTFSDSGFYTGRTKTGNSLRVIGDDKSDGGLSYQSKSTYYKVSHDVHRDIELP